jgi:predicted phage terminase large subunit-like protein
MGLADQLSPDHELRPWRDWLAQHFPHYTTAPFGERHLRFWQWVTDLEPGVRPRPRVEVWPRGGAKSTTIELGCAYLGAAPAPRRHYVLYVSETQAQANKHVQAIAAMLERVGIRRALNEYGASKGWRHEEIRTANGFNVTAFGLDAGMRGVKLDEYRPDVIVMDDIDGRHDTEATREKKIATITETILPAGSIDCAVIVIQNKITADSIVAQLCDGRADFLHDRLPAVVEPAVIDLQYDRVIDAEGLPKYQITGGEPTWEGQNLATCERQLNDWGKDAFMREAQQEVADIEGSMLKREWFIPYTVPALRYQELVQYWDTAFKDGKDNSYSACVTMGVSALGYDVLDVYRGRPEFPVLCRMAVDQWRRIAGIHQGVKLTVCVEDKASGPSLVQTLRAGHSGIPVVLVNPRDATKVTSDVKEANVGLISPLVESGQVRIPEWTVWLKEFIDELVQFPLGTFDDQVDAFAGALIRLSGAGSGASPLQSGSYIGDDEDEIDA